MWITNIENVLQFFKLFVAADFCKTKMSCCLFSLNLCLCVCVCVKKTYIRLVVCGSVVALFKVSDIKDLNCSK